MGRDKTRIKTKGGNIEGNQNMNRDEELVTSIVQYLL